MSSGTDTFSSFFSTGYVQFLSCSVGNADWAQCMLGGRILPAAFIWGIWGAIKFITTQFGFFSQLDVPPYEGDVPGAVNV